MKENRKPRVKCHRKDRANRIFNTVNWIIGESIVTVLLQDWMAVENTRHKALDLTSLGSNNISNYE
jgi:hypothetical protein